MASTVFPVAGGGAVIRKQTTFTSSGTFTLPAGYGAGQPLLVDIEICGGGGGGGGGGKHGSNQTGYGGSGGGSGVVMLYKNISLTANATITLGAGGNGGAGTASAGSNGSNGASGGTSNVNSLYFAPGGGAGSYGSYTDRLTTRRGFGVNSYGFYIPGGMIPGQQNTPGAGGGSGSSTSNESTSTAATANWGGSHGNGGWTGPRDFTNMTTNTNWTVGSSRSGNGINSVRADLNTSANNEFAVTTSSSEIAFLQRGAGGNGGAGQNAQWGQGGFAGTKTDGGRSGFMNVSSGSANGETATDAGAGGGGGGGTASAGGTTGTGGAGAIGYCIITYWG